MDAYAVCGESFQSLLRGKFYVGSSDLLEMETVGELGELYEICDQTAKIAMDMSRAVRGREKNQTGFAWTCARQETRWKTTEEVRRFK